MKKSIRFKILFIFIGVLLIFTLSSIWSIINFNRLTKSIDNIMESNYRSVEAAQSMITAIERQDSAQLAYMFSESDETVIAFNENEKIFIAWLSRAEDNITERGEKEILDKINTYYLDYISTFTTLLTIDRRENSTALNDYYYNEVLPIFDKTKAASRELLSLNQNSMVRRKDRAHDIAISATVSTITVSSLVIIISLVLVTIMTNKIVKPLYNFVDKIKKISEGNYDQKLLIQGNDEIAQLAQEFNIMAEKLLSYDAQRIQNLHEEKNKSEAIVSSISDGILVTDHEHRIKLMNHKAERIFGVRQQEVLNKHLLEVVNDERMFALFKRVNEHPYDQTYKKYDEIQININQEINYYRVNVRPVKMKSGASLGMVALIQDITKIKEVDQMKSDFISTVSHEFRTPLTSITMGVGLLLEEIPGALSSKQKELVEAIKEDSERLNNLVGELLDLSKLESGKMEMDLQEHELSSVINYVVKLFKLQVKDVNGQIISSDFSEFSKVSIDINKITWVVSNLIGNALRYIPKDGTGQIEVKGKELYGKVIIEVKDNGSGMNENIQKHIFDKFIQDSEKGGGAGLGLAICKEIIKAHGGDIWVESKLGKGTSFYFTINTI